MKHICPLVVCNVLLVLNSCQLMPKLLHQKAKAEPVATEQADAQDNGETPAAEQPSESQQEAARKLLEGDGTLGGIEGALEGVNLGEPADSNPLVEPVTDYTATGGVPGKRGIRMGTLAAPEDAAGAEVKPLGPNSAERRGLRQPPLPKGLPMDMNGKLNPETTD